MAQEAQEAQRVREDAVALGEKKAVGEVEEQELLFELPCELLSWLSSSPFYGASSLSAPPSSGHGAPF